MKCKSRYQADASPSQAANDCNIRRTPVIHGSCCTMKVSTTFYSQNLVGCIQVEAVCAVGIHAATREAETAFFLFLCCERSSGSESNPGPPGFGAGCLPCAICGTPQSLLVEVDPSSGNTSFIIGSENQIFSISTYHRFNGLGRHVATREVESAPEVREPSPPSLPDTSRLHPHHCTYFSRGTAQNQSTPRSHLQAFNPVQKKEAARCHARHKSQTNPTTYHRSMQLR